MATRSGVQIRRPKGKSPEDIVEALRVLADVEVLVGVPEETTDDHADRDALGEEPITNASLLYIHDHGAPEVNLPARPMMRPGIDAVKDKIARLLRRTATIAFETGDVHKVEASMHEIGITAQLSIQNTMRDGIPPPLSDRTLQERMRKHPTRAPAYKAELARRKAGEDPSMVGAGYFKPLVDTSDLLKSITYAIRSRKKRSR